jgi:hypothetical protein
LCRATTFQSQSRDNFSVARHKNQWSCKRIFKDHETIQEEETLAKPKPQKSAPPRRRRKSSLPPRFCFFDYSMIPDKDPRSGKLEPVFFF